MSGFAADRSVWPTTKPAFRHFLAVERTRAERSQRFLYLVLVSIRQHPGRRAKLTYFTATALLRGLGAAVREVDFVGWYLERQVAAAVLAQGVNAADGAASIIADRVLVELKKQLSSADSRNLRVRIIRLGGRNGA